VTNKLTETNAAFFVITDVAGKLYYTQQGKFIPQTDAFLDGDPIEDLAIFDTLHDADVTVATLMSAIPDFHVRAAVLVPGKERDRTSVKGKLAS